jgi:serine/threonine protein phosphatase PrpC
MGKIPGYFKPNQDNYICVKDFCKIEGLWLFAVCDGHG